MAYTTLNKMATVLSIIGIAVCNRKC